MTTPLSALRRPRLLIRAARFGIADYDRHRALPRLVDIAGRSGPDEIIDALMSAEADAEHQRRAGLATYSIARHIELLVALIAEARMSAHRGA